ncbi:MAG TPA: STAS domain-containing protein [Phycisphaerae bacterium]|nr:STAS domain-containing protein [Phycisphaerae bacterium]
MAEGNNSVKEIRQKDGATLVTLMGEVDLHHTPEVHKALVAACREQPQKLVINLDAVTYLDSSGIGTLVEVFRRINGYGGKLVLCGLSDRVHSVFEITKLDRFFRICKTEAEALST